MGTKKTAYEFLRTVDNTRRFGKLLYNHIEGPKERPIKIFILDDLRETGRARLKDIAARTGQSPQNLCMLYNGMEKEGLVGREVDPGNKRNTYYWITSKGESLIEENKDKVRKVIEIAFAKLSNDELKDLKESLKKSNKIIEKVLEFVS